MQGSTNLQIPGVFEHKDGPPGHRGGALILGFTVLLISALLMLRQIVEPKFFVRVMTGFGESKPNTVMGFLFLATALIFVDSSRWPLRLTSRICALCAALLGVLTGLEYITGWNPGLDQLFFSFSSPLLNGSPHPSRMAPLTALNLALLGGSILLLDTRIGRLAISSVLVWTAAVLSFLTLTAYAFDPGSHAQLGIFSAVTLPTSLIFLLLCAAILLTRPQRGVAALLLGPDLGGEVVRRLLPAVIVLPFAVSLLILRMYQHHAYGLALMVFLFVVAPVFIFLPLLLLSGSVLNRIERRRKQSEEDLRITTQRFSSVVGSAMDAIITLDESQRVIVFNDAAEAMFRCPSWDAIGKTLDRFLPSEVHEQHSKHIRRFGESGRTTRSMTSPAVLSAIRTNGERFPIEATISHVQVAGQELFTVILRDITARKLAEETLLLSEARFRSIYEQAAVGIAQVALDGRFLMVNAALCRMLGYEETELLARRVNDILHPDDQARETDWRRAIDNNPAKSHEIEKRYIHRDRSVVWVYVSSSVVSDAKGAPLYSISVIQNVSESKRAEEQLKQAQKLEAIGRLAGGVAHDFNTLLNVMLGYSELLLADLSPDDPRRERVVQIKNSGEAGALLTRQLLAFSRKQAVAPEVLDMREIVTKMTPILARLLHEDVALNVKCSDERCLVKADPGQIQQIILNLGANAGDAMPDGGQINIEVKPVDIDQAYVKQHPMLDVGRYVMLAIGDSGIGMDAETAAHIFEPFFTTKEAGKGTGLGLATVYGIVKRNGGDIWLYSEIGVGTIFKIYLPLAPAEQVRRPESAPRVVRHHGGGGETILLVEDSPALRELTRVILVREGYHVLEAEDGVAAMEVSRKFEGTIHLVLTDVVMPRMRGPALASEISRERPSIAVVFLSGYSEESILHMDGIAGATLVEKPYTSEVLVHSVRRSLDERASRIAARAD
jgi:PAS domain S-box-containing protein